MGILEKIKQADGAMRPELQSRVLEFHPELAWAKLAGEYLGSKRSREGQANREKMIREYVPSLENIYVWQNKIGRAAKVDDVLDALIGLAVAHDALKGIESRIPKDGSERDSRGLSMEIWF